MNLHEHIARLKRLLKIYAFSPIEKQKLQDEITELEKETKAHQEDMDDILKTENTLIAAAPELFEQCKLFEKVLTELAHEGEPEAMEMRNELRELLAKVEGEK